MTQPHININNITVKYNAHVAIQDVSLSVMPKDFIGIIGENGSGKTTLIKTILGTLKPTKGSIIIKDGIRIGYLPQHIMRQNSMFPATSEEVVKMGLMANKTFPRHYTKKDHKKVIEMFTSLHISDLRKKRIGLLSGGQQQRVMLARALINDPDVLILDEPTSALDRVIEQSFLETLKRLNQTRNTTIVIITHDLAALGDYINKILYLDKTVLFAGDFDTFCNKSTLSPYLIHHRTHACKDGEIYD
ncbi:MAG: metal ABC transporter ATP-binding protein [Bacillota bacterium]